MTGVVRRGQRTRRLDFPDLGIDRPKPMSVRGPSRSFQASALLSPRSPQLEATHAASRQSLYSLPPTLVNVERTTPKQNVGDEPRATGEEQLLLGRKVPSRLAVRSLRESSDHSTLQGDPEGVTIGSPSLHFRQLTEVKRDVAQRVVAGRRQRAGKRAPASPVSQRGHDATVPTPDPARTAAPNRGRDRSRDLGLVIGVAYSQQLRCVARRPRDTAGPPDCCGVLEVLGASGGPTPATFPGPG
ncbi:hypothetical protein IscW_ISCW018684 [Ixodes scapularis]|uniref:Uncharacterized protein n=1 Tax=Ixodes scapularis TaxID=6945 RepID=B7PLF2_IXOSC|nr:hypothetical protein IscW_ISCW018684 [Ixodes scapularis]|eukprot:XP_002434600.1 hypothetical protein IscW_ISCW018684 [Ixodes scapularis]